MMSQNGIVDTNHSMDEIAEQQEDEMQDQSICLYDVAQDI